MSLPIYRTGLLILFVIGLIFNYYHLSAIVITCLCTIELFYFNRKDNYPIVIKWILMLLRITSLIFLLMFILS